MSTTKYKKNTAPPTGPSVAPTAMKPMNATSKVNASPKTSRVTTNMFCSGQQKLQ